MKVLRLILGMLVALSVICAAQDVITLTDGDELHGLVLSYSEGQFVIRIGQEQRAFPSGDVESIAFGADVVAKSPSPKAVTPALAVKPRTTPAPMLGSTAATHDSGDEIRMTITEFNARKADMVGRIVKLSFLYRGDIQSVGEGEYETSLWDDDSTTLVRFGQEAFPYVESIKTLDYRWRNRGLAKRGYYLFGKAAVHSDAFGGVRFKPIGRTKKGDAYVW